MLKPIAAGSGEGRARVRALARRDFSIPEDVLSAVDEIIMAVRAEGDEALVRYTSEFDCPVFAASDILVSDEEIERAYSLVEPDFMEALAAAKENITAFHRQQMPKSWFVTGERGMITGQMVRPVDSAGLYVPGGKGGETPLVSSVLMNAIPAKIAGVGRVVMATPPSRDRSVSPSLLVAAREVEVDAVYKVGSAWAIAALAYSTATVDAVDVIVGPGNIYVTAAKYRVSGVVGLDMIAGPSEVLVIADASASPVHVAADMLSQAEHDPLATAILVTTSERLAEEVAEELERQLAMLERSDIARRSLDERGLILVVSSLDEAVSIANTVAPEHLELLVADPWGLLPGIRHAGAIFLGPYSPEPVGDYIAGPNHVLPTMGTARFSSALGVETFLKRSSIISCTKAAFEFYRDKVVALAEKEGLTAHANSVRVR